MLVVAILCRSRSRFAPTPQSVLHAPCGGGAPTPSWALSRLLRLASLH